MFILLGSIILFGLSDDCLAYMLIRTSSVPVRENPYDTEPLFIHRPPTFDNNHGKDEADRPQEYSRQGPSETARHNGSKETRTTNRWRQEA